MTQTELEKQILDIINLRISTFLSSLPSMQREQAAKEIASLMEQKPDINTPFFGNSGVKIPVTEQNSYPKEFVLWLQDDCPFWYEMITKRWFETGLSDKEYDFDELYLYWQTNVKDK